MDADNALAGLGFTDLESQLYCELLKDAPATGYRLAQLVKKAAANVYQALAVLEQKGAVVVDAGDTKSFRPVGPEELMAALQARFTERREAATLALQKLHAPARSDKIFQLRDVLQAVTRARQMLNEAREIVLFDLFPEPLRLLGEDLEAAAARGVQVAGIVYALQPDAGFHCILSQGQARTIERWPGSQLTLVVDAREFLVALLSPDSTQLRHGLWSDSLYLSCLQHSGLACEIRLAALGLCDRDPLASLSLLPSMPDGLRKLNLFANKSLPRDVEST